MKVFRFMKPEWRAMILILFLLVGQAACELALPGFTSSLVNVGVQQNGIPSALADSLSAQGMASLLPLMDDLGKDQVQAAYQEQDGVYLLQKNLPEDAKDATQAALAKPMALVFSLSQMPGGEAILQQLSSGQVNLETLKTRMADQLPDQVALGDALPQQMLDAAAAQFVQQDYLRQGIDLNAVRNRFLWQQGLSMLGITLLMGLFALGSSFLGARAGARVGRDLRSAVFSRVLSFSKAEVDKFSTASLITRSTNDIAQVQQTSVMMLRMLMYAPIMAAGGIYRVIRQGTGMGWIIALTVGLMLLLVLVMAGLVTPKFKLLQKLTDRMNLVARENLTGIQVIRAFSRQDHENQRFETANKDLAWALRFINRTFAFMMPSMMLMMNGVTLLILWFGAKGIDLGQMQVGDMMAFISYTMQIAFSFMMIAMVSAVMMPRAEVAAQRVREVLDTEPSIHSKENPSPLAPGGQGHIRFEKVSFRYPDSQEEVLCDLSFDVLPGQTTAVIGATGSGKSTLLNLIPRFFDVSEGRILLDGVDIRDLSLHDLRSQLGLVPQTPLLFSGTIESNLHYAGEAVTEDQARLAAQIAQASNFIQEKEGGMQAEVSQGASNFSGGQKQRLSIARALAGQPKVLLFDDSFSALDYVTDQKVRRALKQELQDTTLLIVAQRIATVLQADKILVLENGRLIAQGSHRELMEHSTAYREIALSQLSLEELNADLQQEGGGQHV